MKYRTGCRTCGRPWPRSCPCPQRPHTRLWLTTIFAYGLCLFVGVFVAAALIGAAL